MPGISSEAAVKNTGLSQIGESEQARLDVHQLTTLAAKGLVQMYDPENQLFCFRLKRTQQGLVREGYSHRYTIISLLGLHRLETEGVASPINARAMLDSLVRDTSWMTNLGDLGLLLWLCALACPERGEELRAKFDIKRALDSYPEGRQGRTMELAWFLTGLAHQMLARGGNCPELRDAARNTYRRLKDNQGDHGIFGHLARKGSLTGLLRGRIGSFADQIYPIYALTCFAQAYQVQEALERARLCAEAICYAQGSMGQWWWHYNCSTGKVVGRYPVYSVHQDGMAPMALFALGEAIGSDFGSWIYKGLQWIAGNNELDYDLRECAANVIWRGIYPRGYKRYLSGLTLPSGSHDNRGPHNNLAIQFECRPYHFGWLLYAFAARTKPASIKKPGTALGPHAPPAGSPPGGCTARNSSNQS